MKSGLKRELGWVLGTISLAFTIGLTFFGNKLFNGRPLDLQLHDTYFIFPKSLLLIVISILLLGGVYLNRGIYKRLNNRFVSVPVAIVLTCVLLELIAYWNWVYGYVKDSGYYWFDERSQTERISEFTMTSWLLAILVPLTLVTILTTGYKIVRPKSLE